MKPNQGVKVYADKIAVMNARSHTHRPSERGAAAIGSASRIEVIREEKSQRVIYYKIKGLRSSSVDTGK